MIETGERLPTVDVWGAPSTDPIGLDSLIAGGIRSILNYAPVVARVPRHLRDEVQIQNIDPVLALQGMTYYLKEAAETAAK